MQSKSTELLLTELITQVHEIRTDLQGYREEVQQFERRLDKLEGSKAKAMGFLAGLTTIAGATGAGFSNLIEHLKST